MHREDWDAVYLNQDKILNSLKGLKSNIFLAGGTGLHRFVLRKPYRHSEDLDFFFPNLVKNKEMVFLEIYLPYQLGQVLEDINAKFEDAIGIRYEKNNILQSLQHDLKWDIEIGEIEYFHDLQIEINSFCVQLKETIVNEEIFDFSYQKRIEKRSKIFNLDISRYLELIDLIEENNFWINEVKSLKYM